MELDGIVFERATSSDTDGCLHIIHRCVREVVSRYYEPWQVERFIQGFTAEWLSDIIATRHFYSVKRGVEIVGMGGVSRDVSQERQSYLTAIFINPDYQRMGIGRKLITFLEQDEWCLESNLIEVPSSKAGHEFYHKLGYAYRTNPPVFKEDGSTIMYKYKELN